MIDEFIKSDLKGDSVFFQQFTTVTDKSSSGTKWVWLTKKEPSTRARVRANRWVGGWRAGGCGDKHGLPATTRV